MDENYNETIDEDGKRPSMAFSEMIIKDIQRQSLKVLGPKFFKQIKTLEKT